MFLDKPELFSKVLGVALLASSDYHSSFFETISGQDMDSRTCADGRCLLGRDHPETASPSEQGVTMASGFDDHSSESCHRISVLFTSVAGHS